MGIATYPRGECVLSVKRQLSFRLWLARGSPLKAWGGCQTTFCSVYRLVIAVAKAVMTFLRF
ncbi:MAG: hypothetical protein O4861_24875 [Trichodesmium sp. St16_bin4-tuft]|nr:hypothetical protein [Trichodesmium sp. MAG_R01]MDE5069075.1 hypothetical protein [Trichodesmium sp. St4_bin8_1]MDE5072590.1 hypothetical protein [Trichodesmium sp. St5_bin8]MDE5077924.1 hypothetical protein [Trichodesmium sp. St2_bin6]MDE5101385.1 hypothetical protein [Trichodesmium sp. St16_bin4-tuft]MDE5102160.1 hypothetical protein [Trichodesmium sp. St19_bin2]